MKQLVAALITLLLFFNLSACQNTPEVSPSTPTKPNTEVTYPPEDTNVALTAGKWYHYALQGEELSYGILSFQDGKFNYVNDSAFNINILTPEQQDQLRNEEPTRLIEFNGETYVMPRGVWVLEGDYTENDDGTVTLICTEPFDDSATLQHTDNILKVITDSQIISLDTVLTCGEAEHVHSFNSATCSQPETCSVCGYQQGFALDHTYTNGVCSICGQQESKPHELTEGFWYTYDEYGQLVVVIEFSEANRCYVYHYGDAVPPGSPSDSKDPIRFDNETLYAQFSLHTFSELQYTVEGNRIIMTVQVYDYSTGTNTKYPVVWEAVDQDHYKIISSDIEANEPGFFSYQVGQTITWSSTFIPK
jgi:hypothetical protein